MRAFGLFLLLLAACGAAPPRRTESQQADYDQAVKDGRILRGMTKAEVRAVRGPPRSSDRVERYGGTVLRWIYPFDEIYFDARGIVVGWQKAY